MLLGDKTDDYIDATTMGRINAASLHRLLNTFRRRQVLRGYHKAGSFEELDTYGINQGTHWRCSMGFNANHKLDSKHSSAFGWWHGCLSANN